MGIIEKMCKIHNRIWHPLTIKRVINIVVALPLIIMLYTLATICHFVEHLHNFCTGKGWTGLKIW